MAANSATNSGSLYRAAVSTGVDNFSFSSWIYLNSLAADDYCIFQNGTTGSFGEGWGLFYNSSLGKLAVDVNFITEIDFNTTLSVSTWYHVILTRNAGTWTCYINNVAEATTSTSTPFAISANSRTCVFGYWTDGTTINNNGTNMRMSKVGYWDRVITGTERANLANCSQVPSDLATNLLVSLPLSASASFPTNGGSAGNFTLNGTLADASEPSSCVVTPASTLHGGLTLLGVG
jgi:hypothetical protein